VKSQTVNPQAGLDIFQIVSYTILLAALKYSSNAIQHVTADLRY